MSVFLCDAILGIYTYLCNVFAYFENFMRYIIYKMHILYNNVRKRARDAHMCADVRECAQMCASIPAPARHDASFNMLFLIKVGKCDKMPRFAGDAHVMRRHMLRNDIACGGYITL